jgi:hypothetical protein
MDPAQLPLRDIHLPNPVSWWPPAIGWWCLLALIILIVIVGIKLFQYRNKIKYSPANMAKQSLQSIRSKYIQDGDTQYLIREISSLMRRLCISIFPRQQTASLVGDDWLLFLDESMKHSTKGHMSKSHPESVNLFTEGVGRVLSEGPYRQQSDVDGKQLLTLCEAWVSQVSNASNVKSLRDSKK